MIKVDICIFNNKYIYFYYFKTIDIRVKKEYFIFAYNNFYFNTMLSIQANNSSKS